MNRGAARQPTFTNARDRQDFTDLWREAVTRFGIVVLAYAWMGNHFHVLLCSPDGQLSATLRHVGQVYTQRYNRRHERDGALFRGRFHSILVDSDHYLDRVARYIERNPLESHAVSPSDLPTYKWSSLHHYLSPLPDDWVSTSLLLQRVGGRHAYLQHVLSDQHDHELQQFYRQTPHPRVVLGKTPFVEALPPEVRQLNPLAGVPEIAAAELDHAIETVVGSLSPQARLLAVDLGRSLARSTGHELAQRYGYPSLQAVYSAAHKARNAPELQGPRNEVLRYLGRPGG